MSDLHHRNPFSFNSDKIQDKANFRSGVQDFGTEFEFQEDEAALESIILNKGIQQPQRYANQQKLKDLTPAKSHAGFRGEVDKLEFFQGRGGNIFFRRKVTPCKTKRALTTLNIDPEFLKPVRMGPGSHRKENSMKSSLKENKVPGISRSEKKVVPEMFAAPHRQSISERKPRSFLPQPSFGSSLAKKSLKFGQSSKDNFLKPQVPLHNKQDRSEGIASMKEQYRPDLPLPALTRLNRESFKFLPRESLAWLTQLPRDSATFCELEKLMGDSDKQLLNEDDTFSFEAMECRLKTPMKIATTHRLPQEEIEEEIKPFTDEKNSSLSVTPIKENTFSDELSNLPSDPILSTPTIKSSSMSNLAQARDDSVPVHRAQSEENLENLAQSSRIISSDHFNQILSELQEYREEQDELERQQQELTNKIRARKAAFKELWGVSPMSINKIRTVLPNKPTLEPNQQQTQIDETPQSSINENSGETLDETPLLLPPGTEPRKVRFNSGNNEAKYLTPDSSYQNTPQSHAASANTSFSNQSFASLKSSFAFLQTPATAPHPKKMFDHRFEEREEEQENNLPVPGVQRGVPTPMALKSLSARVREEFAALYADSDESENISEDIIKKLKF